MKKIKKRIKIKKRNKTYPSPKKVNEYVHFKAKSNSEGVIHINLGKNGEINCPEAEEGSINSYSSYRRDSGNEKRIVRSYTKNGTASIKQRDNILKNYDALAGIDTNNYEISGRRISITSSYYADLINLSSIEFKLMPAFVIRDVSASLNPELIGWHLFFIHILPLLKLPNGKKLGLVVDSELERHIAFNSRDEPYYKEHYLPENIGLIYASADTGRDVPNQLIKACDRSSRLLFKQIQRREVELPLHLGGRSNDFSGYAFVNCKGLEYKIEKQFY